MAYSNVIGGSNIWNKEAKERKKVIVSELMWVAMTNTVGQTSHVVY